MCWKVSYQKKNSYQWEENIYVSEIRRWVKEISGGVGIAHLVGFGSGGFGGVSFGGFGGFDGFEIWWSWWMDLVEAHGRLPIWNLIPLLQRADRIHQRGFNVITRT